MLESVAQQFIPALHVLRVTVSFSYLYIVGQTTAVACSCQSLPFIVRAQKAISSAAETYGN